MSADEAKLAAWRGALAVSQDHRNVAAAVLHDAELAVLRRLAAAHLPGGEAEYWQLVEQEVRR